MVLEVETELSENKLIQIYVSILPEILKNITINNLLIEIYLTLIPEFYIFIHNRRFCF